MIFIQSTKGYSLIETLIAVTIFAIIMVVAVDTLLVAQSAARKIALERAAMENVAITMESITKKIREGYAFHCRTNGHNYGGEAGTRRNCLDGGTKLAFRGNNNEAYVFRTVNETVQVYEDKSSNPVFPTTENNLKFLPLTSPEVQVKSLKFYVRGADLSDQMQPLITITITGVAKFGGGEDLETDFFIQSTVSPRRLDI